MGIERVVLRRSRKLKYGRYPIVIRHSRQRNIYIFIRYSGLEMEWEVFQSSHDSEHPTFPYRFNDL
jgi:hypothetical protein